MKNLAKLLLLSFFFATFALADSKVSDLPLATGLNDGDYLYLVAAGSPLTSKKVTFLTTKQATYAGVNGGAIISSTGLLTIANLSVTNAMLAGNIDAAKIYDGSINNTEFSYLNGVTSSIQTQLNGKEPSITGGTNLQYWRGDKTFQTLDTSVVPENGSLYYTNPRTIASTLTGYSSGAGTISSSDSIIQAIQKLNGNIGALTTGVSSVSNSDGTITFSPTSGAVVGSLALSHANSWTGQQTFNTSSPIFGTTTATTVPYLNASKQITSSAVTPTELGYLSGVTSSIQTQLNALQPSGNYITALTGDATASGPGSASLTLATVNTNTGSFGSATNCATVMLNTKGLVISASQTLCAPAESSVTFTNITTNNVSITKHGYAPILPNDATKYLDGTGAYSIPPGTSSGSVSSVSVIGANGFAGSVATATTTPAITISTSITGILKGNGTAISAASSGTDYVVPAGNVATATALATGRTISISGDLTYSSPSFDGSGNVTAAGTLATVNSNVGSFGSATNCVSLTANGKGLITAVSAATCTPAIGSVSGLGTGVATALGNNVGSAGAPVTFNGALGTPSSGTATNLTGTAASLTAGAANAINSATTTVNVSSATAPSSGQVLTATSSTAATWQAISAGLIKGTAVATTSGTSIDFTSLPSTIKTISIGINGVSTNGSSVVIVQLRASGAAVTSGYLGAASGGGGAVSSFTTGVAVSASNSASDTRNGIITFVNISGNIWVASGAIVLGNAALISPTGTTVTLGATLDGIRITTVNGTDTFDAGSVNIYYQ